MNKDYSEILLEAAAIAKERQSQYGEATDSIRLACKILDETFNVKLTPYEYCMVMVSLKLSRLKFKYKEDSMIDCINYIAIAIQSKRNENNI